MSRLKLFLFGPPRVEQNDQTVDVRPRKALALLIYLAVTRQPFRRDALAALFWPDSDQQSARASLRRTLYQITQMLGKVLFDIEPEVVAIGREAVLWLDVAEFQQGATQILALDPTALSSEPSHGERLAALVDLYHNDFLAGFNLPDCPEFDDWQFFVREELRQQLAQALQALILVCETQQNYNEAAAYARRWLALDPMHEVVHRELMRIYALAGQHAAALRQYETCVRILDEELGAAPEAETTHLYELIRAKQISAARPDGETKVRAQVVAPPPMRNDMAASFPLPAPATPVVKLPTDQTIFVGREAELAQLHNLLKHPRCRLITLVGLGGIGKTQLALEIARQVTESTPSSFADGVVFVSLLEIENVHALPFALMDALNLPLASPSNPMQQVIQFLRSRQMLLILDNAEHLLPTLDGDLSGASLTDLLKGLVERCPHLKLLVTSREPLLMQAEWRMDLKGLTYPDPTTETSIEDRQQREEKPQAYSAVQLFQQIARQQQPGFQVTAENQAWIHRLCQLVAGMPLALKLAARWSRLFPIQRIVSELENNYDFLSTNLRDVPPRQQSMRAVFDYTWALLSAEEQHAFQLLSIFHGGFSEEAAVQVADVPPDLLAGLLDRGLLQVHANASGNRYRLHELIRQFAAEKLNAAPDLKAEVHQRHSTYYLALLQTLDVNLQGRNQQAILETIHQDLDNVCAVWNHLVAQREARALLQASDFLHQFYWTRCRAHEGKEIFANAIAQLERTPTQWPQEEYAALLRMLVHQRGLFNYFLGDYAAAHEDFERATEVARQAQMPLEIGRGLCMLGTLARCQAKRVTAETYLQESLRIFQTLGHKNDEADVLQELAQLYAYFGEHERAADLATQSLSISRALERLDWIAWALETLGWISFISGDYEKSRRCYEESLALFRSIGHQLGTALALGGLGVVGWALGGNQNLAKAHSALEESMEICRRLGHQLHLASRLHWLAQINNDLEEYATAQVYAQQGVELARALDSALFVTCNLCCLAEAAYYQGEFESSRSYLYEAIEGASNAGLRSTLATALFHLATCFVIESELVPMAEIERTQKQSEALELLARVEQEETCWTVYRQRSQRRRSELLRKLPPAIAEMATARMATRTLEAQTATLLAAPKRLMSPGRSLV